MERESEKKRERERKREGKRDEIRASANGKELTG
jgi:hypothetical protein